MPERELTRLCPAEGCSEKMDLKGSWIYHDGIYIKMVRLFQCPKCKNVKIEEPEDW